MNRDEIIRMAEESTPDHMIGGCEFDYAQLEHFATLVYERAFIDGMQKQMQSSVDKAVNKMAQREWQGLTEEEKVEIQALKWWDWEDTFDLDGYTRAIEAKLKEKNT
jgi:hypothetical protein